MLYRVTFRVPPSIHIITRQHPDLSPLSNHHPERHQPVRDLRARPSMPAYLEGLRKRIGPSRVTAVRRANLPAQRLGLTQTQVRSSETRWLWDTSSRPAPYGHRPSEVDWPQQVHRFHGARQVLNGASRSRRFGSTLPKFKTTSVRGPAAARGPANLFGCSNLFDVGSTRPRPIRHVGPDGADGEDRCQSCPVPTESRSPAHALRPSGNRPPPGPGPEAAGNRDPPIRPVGGPTTVFVSGPSRSVVNGVAFALAEMIDLTPFWLDVRDGKESSDSPDPAGPG